MNKLIPIIIAFIFITNIAGASGSKVTIIDFSGEFYTLDIDPKTQKCRVNGVVLTQDFNPVEYCSVNFSDVKDPARNFSTLSDSLGRFTLEIPSGEYNSLFSALSCETKEMKVIFTDDHDMDKITLNTSALNVDVVVVKAPPIIRKSNGYVINISDNPIAKGKNTLDVMSYAPGVRTNSSGELSINGRSGTQVMIDGKKLEMDPKQIKSYLQSINAEDVKSMEVISSAGAQYDASATGGIINIVLKKSSYRGFSGSASFDYQQSDSLPVVMNPNLKLSYAGKKVSSYINLNYLRENMYEWIDEYTHSFNPDYKINNNINGFRKSNYYLIRTGAIYDINEKNSLGAEFSMYYNDNKFNFDSKGSLPNDKAVVTRSFYDSFKEYTRYHIRTNYKLAIDSLGSNFSVEANYHVGDNHEPSNIILEDARLRTRALTNMRVEESNLNKIHLNYAVAKADYSKYFNNNYSLMLGAKYTYAYSNTKMEASMLEENVWTPDLSKYDHYLYREGTLAGYASFSGEWNKFSLTAGLRVENTQLRPHSFITPAKDLNRSYTDLFPSFSGAFRYGSGDRNSLSLNFNRTIQRPLFEDLNPYRVPINTFTYLEGNPDLAPAYVYTGELTLTLHNKYSVGLGMMLENDAIAQVILQDSEHPGVMLYKNMNVDNISNYYVMLNFPVDITPWWNVAFDLYGSYMTNTYNGIKSGMFGSNGSVKNLFTLPAKISLEVNESYITDFLQGNFRVKATSSLDVVISKSFLKDKLSVSVYGNDLYNGNTIKMRVINDSNFTKSLQDRHSLASRNFGVRLAYRFKTGKNIKERQVESDQTPLRF